jgi:hypothetical protein
MIRDFDFAVRDYDAAWLEWYIKEAGWKVDRSFYDDADDEVARLRRDALMWPISYVATRCPTNDDLRHQSEAMLRMVIEPDLETRMLLLREDGEQLLMRCPDDGEATHQIVREDILSALLNLRGMHSNTESLLEGAEDHNERYLFPLVGKRSLRDDMQFPKNENVVVGALYISVQRPFADGLEKFLCTYALDIGPKLHLKYHRKVTSELYSFKDAMLSESSHNLANTTTAIIAKLMLIEKELHGPVPEDLKMPLDILTNQIKYLEMRLRRYGESARQGKLIYNPRPTDLKTDIVDSLLAKYSSQLAAKGAKFLERYDTSFINDTVNFTCDPLWLHEALENEIKNIVDHAPRKCRIAIGYSQDENYHLLHVWSSGPHIDPEKLAQRESSIKEDHTMGHGVGLQSVRRIAELHGGKFELKHTDSHKEGEGPGNDMIIYIPKGL